MSETGGSQNPQNTQDLIDKENLKKAQLQNELQKQLQDLQVEKQKAEMMNARGLNADGSPIEKAFETIANPDGSLKEGYVVSDWQNVSANKDALSKLRDTALRDPGQASLWAQLEGQKLGIKQQDLLDTGARQGASAYTAAQSNLAQTGGLSGAQRERLARNNMRDTTANAMSARRQGLMDQLNISSQDETNRLSGLNTLQGLENAQAQFGITNQQNAKHIEQTNVGNRLNEITQGRAWKANNYNKQMEGWAAGQSADAQARASSGGGKK